MNYDFIAIPDADIPLAVVSGGFRPGHFRGVARAKGAGQSHVRSRCGAGQRVPVQIVVVVVAELQL